MCVCVCKYQKIIVFLIIAISRNQSSPVVTNSLAYKVCKKVTCSSK